MYEVQKLNALKHHVVKAGVGTVFVGKREQCELYVAQKSGTVADQRGVNPEITR